MITLISYFLYSTTMIYNKEDPGVTIEILEDNILKDEV